MKVLSAYYLDDSRNARIADAVAAHGGEFVPSPEDRDERLLSIDRHISDTNIFFGGRLTAEQFEKAVSLKWIHVPWAGVNSLLGIEGIRRSGITVTNSSGVMSDSVADQVMGYVILLSRSLHEQIRAQDRREWLRYSTESPRRQRLRGRTIGIVGFGAIGREVAARARAFGMRVAVTRRNASDTPPDVDGIYAPDRLGDLLAESDFVVVALPLTPETQGLIGRDEFGRMKAGACIINISRGGVIDEEAMIDALKRGAIAGAGLDVFRTEPLPEDSPLWGMKDVIVTPHSSGGFRGFSEAVVDLFLDNLDRFLSGHPLRNPVDTQRGY